MTSRFMEDFAFRQYYLDRRCHVAVDEVDPKPHDFVLWACTRSDGTLQGEVTMAEAWERFYRWWDERPCWKLVDDQLEGVLSAYACDHNAEAVPLVTTGQSEVLYHYVVIRSDLPRGMLAAQVVHAAGESSPGGLPEGTCAVVLAAPGHRDLEDVLVRLQAAQVACVGIREPDQGDELMAIGVVPGRKEDLKRHFANLPLLK